MDKSLKISAFALIITLLSCNSNPNTNSLMVATAANLRFAMEELNLAFEKETGIKVEMITASSGKLTAQIKNGAPYDVFLSASFKYPQTLFQEGYTLDEPLLFCKGVLVIWTNKDITIDSTLEMLKNDKLQKIAIANPQNAPYGIAAEEVLKRLHLYDEIKPKLIFAENVSQLNQYIINNACDVGITSKSAVLTSQLKNIGRWKELNPDLYSPVMQYVVALKSSTNQKESAKKYVEFLSSKKAVSILRAYGYEMN
ncbi:MAG: molybdate ABC transporter substrate-binding protein [Bacteroidales bacterium]|nr:molybdate ABC transporter substrate-binding protein [Bacteroidales bacterium]